MSAPAGCTTLPRQRTRDDMGRARMSEQRTIPTTGEIFRSASAGARRLTVLALTTVFAAMLAIPSGASARWFTVEIIVFDDLKDESLDAEHWPADPGEPPLQDAVEPTRGHGPGEAAHAFRLAGRADLSLDGVWNALRRSARYRPFLHAGWHVPGLPHGAAQPAHVSPRLGNSGADAAEHDGDGLPTVRGSVKVSLSRYLRVDVDLLYERPGSGEAAAPNTAPARFRLVSERRMRSGELHYIDHPLFGVLILIRPLQNAPRRGPEA